MSWSFAGNSECFAQPVGEVCGVPNPFTPSGGSWVVNGTVTATGFIVGDTSLYDGALLNSDGVMSVRGGLAAGALGGLADVRLGSSVTRNAGDKIVRCMNNATELFVVLGDGAVDSYQLTALTNTVKDSLSITHYSSGTAAAGYGTGILLTGQDASGNDDDMARLSAVWSTATAASETSYFSVQTRSAGASLAESFRVAPTGPVMLTGLSTIWNNTADITTNYERARVFWSADVFSIVTEAGGTGTNRALVVGSGDGTSVRMLNGTYIWQGSAAGYAYHTCNNTLSLGLFSQVTTATNRAGISLLNSTASGDAANFSASSGTQRAVEIQTRVNQSGTAGFEALRIAPIQTSAGSGASYAIAYYGGAAGTTFLWGMRSNGVPECVAAATQATVGGAGGASALPATPSGYMKMMRDGVEYIIPYYLPS